LYLSTLNIHSPDAGGGKRVVKGFSLMGSLLSIVLCAAGVTLVGAEIQSPRVRNLVAESIKKEPFGWSEKNPLLNGDVPEALAYITKHADYTSYHLLTALRKFYPAFYRSVPNEEKSAILCSALRTSTALNDWGQFTPSTSVDGQSAKALLETGKVALKYLAPILDDGSPAILFGSEEATMSVIYAYRRKDFAYRYASLILGNVPVFRADPKDRDKDIDGLKAELRKHAR
jgi:hypothetical protein